jgi:chromosome segregation ATPase
MDEFNPSGGVLGALGAGAAAIITGIIWLRKTLASANADIAGDRAEVNIIQILQDDNARLREELKASESARNEQFRQIAELSAQQKILNERIETMTRTNVQLKEEIERLRSSLEETRR